MTITDPRPLIQHIDKHRFDTLLERQPVPASVPIHQPQPVLSTDNV